MSDNIISQYTSAFIEVIDEEKVHLESIYNNVNELKDAISNDIQYLDLLNSININEDLKKKLVDDLIGNNVYLRNMIWYMIDKNDQKWLLNVIEDILEKIGNQINITTLKITSAFELTKDQIDAICEKVSSKINKKIIPKVIIDKTYIAGISIEYDSKIIDNSVKAKLNEIKNNLI